MDTTGMMDCFIVDKERERLLAQPTQPMIQLVLELIMLHMNSFSRKTFVCYLQFISCWNQHSSVCY